jgi:hypothetical protein
MACTPEERREINRRNSQRSTGPTSTAGKARARLNALRHGLRAEEFALPGEDQEQLKRLTDEWVEYYEPRSPGERAAIDRCVYATVQLQRCAKYHAEAVAEQVRTAQEDWNRKQEDEVEDLKKLLTTDPAEAVRKLRRSTLGCRWLIGGFTELKKTLDAGLPWTPSERDQAIRLLGERPEPETFPDHPIAYRVRYYSFFNRDNPSEEHLAWLTSPKVMPDVFARYVEQCGHADKQCSREWLCAVVEEELAELREIAARLEAEVEGPSRASLVHRSWLLEGPKGALLARYERMHDTSYARYYKLVKAGEVQHEDDIAAIAPRPAPVPPHLVDGVSVLDITAATDGAPNEAIGAGSIPVAEPDSGASDQDMLGVTPATLTVWERYQAYQARAGAAEPGAPPPPQVS